MISKEDRDTRKEILYNLKLVELAIRQTENIHARDYVLKKTNPFFGERYCVELTSFEPMDNKFKLERRHYQKDEGSRRRSSLIEKDLKKSLNKTFFACYTKYPDDPERFSQNFKLEMPDETLRVKIHNINKRINPPELVDYYMDARNGED